MPDLLIKHAELEQLDKLIQEVPTKHGFGIVVFFNQVRGLRNQEAQEEAKAKEAKASQIKDFSPEEKTEFTEPEQF
jgi:hypothetical protein